MMIASWNKVSPVSPISTTFNLALAKGNESMVCQIYWFSLDFGSWCAYLGKQLADFRCDVQDIFFRSIRQQGTVVSTLCSDGEELQACVPWRVPPTDILSVGTRSHCQQRVAFAVFKALFGEDVCRCPFSLLSFQCNF